LDKIVYDAATTSGGSGGPLFNRDGKVIGVNFATLSDFGGSNLAVPVRYADELDQRRRIEAGDVQPSSGKPCE
jgi:serine protease Do